MYYKALSLFLSTILSYMPLIQALRHFIAEKNLKLKASCGYVAAKLRKELVE
ncbi:hypothetical protein UMN179_01830 [Gallibacterium anatis UMN179]|uniref:Uncharacterized protein n=1 Tax=Gallibacterium anatis (strain UMN179) TaxID=1005058 RepID=F4HDF5_GALAU|nr:hypothetical protein UMN179_01830 [Gallibacterium anatis UMN179]